MLLPHVEDVASSACLVPADINRTTFFSSELPPNKKVAEFLDAVQTSIAGDRKSLNRFVEVLRKERTFLKLMGDRIENTYYREYL